MAESLDSTLLEAYELIEANRIDEARKLLVPLLDQYPDEPDLWWVYSHAVDNREEAQRALRRVVELDPSYDEASYMLEELDVAMGESTLPKIQPLESIRSLPPPETTLEPFEDDIGGDNVAFDNFDDGDAFLDEDETGNGPNLILLGGIVVVLILVSAIVLFFAINGNGTPEPTPAIVADAPTETPALGAVALTDVSEPTETASETPMTVDTSAANATNTPDEVSSTSTEDPTATEQATDTEVPTATATEAPTDTPIPEPTSTDTATPTPTVDPSVAIIDTLGDFELSENEPRVIDTSLGETLVVEFCLGEGDRNALLDRALTALANVSLEDATYDALAVSLFDCESGDTLRVIGVETGDVQAFQDGDLDEEAFQLTWTAVG